MKLYIKYMVSQRCKMLVRKELDNLGITKVKVELGVVDILEDVSMEQLHRLKANLKVSALEVIENKKDILIERIKNVIVEMIHYSDELPKTNYSDFLSEKLNYDYTYLSNIFSEEKGITIQQFIILNKIEKVKELLLYGEMNLTEISYRLHYSSISHLSNQFKKVTGMSPSLYEKMSAKRKSNLEGL
ncbi:helix-turn-helix domain-containing protein [Algoriphagus antarcticus]|uniref:AraC-like DNA-binding protein n=1 Tax=Algoriphagus antarcticus TaxID=238540 RepID=A0A3E0E3N1_9BACT|nr:AraC family transcriptional regulator [Algoriphagus antarcticus]REG92892.1 AraC-like DNA-binding protein [Algoriphagus antarcticus]